MQSVLFLPATIAAISVMFGQQAAILLNNQSIVIPMTVGVIITLIGLPIYLYMNKKNAESDHKIKKTA